MTTVARGNGALWFAVGGGPIAWSLDMLAAFAIEQDYCVHGAPTTTGPGAAVPLIAVALVAAAVTIMAGITGWRYLNGVDTGLGDTDADRRRFMARFGMVISVLMLFGIILRLITVLFISPATC